MKARLVWIQILWGMGALALAAQIFGALLAPSPTQARDSERQRATRDARQVSTDRASEPQVSGNGVVEPAGGEIRLAASVNGVIRRILVQEGQSVKSGAILMELENQDEAASVAMGVAEVEARRWDFLRLRRGNRKEELLAAAADSAQALARARMSLDLATRTEKLRELGGSTPEESERFARQAEMDDAAKARAEILYQELAAGARIEEIEKARAELEAARARHERAEVLLAHTVVRAPIAGEILQIRLKPGEYYAATSGPLLLLGDTRSLRVRVDIDERDVGRVMCGARAEVRASAYPDVAFPGSVIDIGRRMGRKNVRSDDPVERNDTKIQEALVALDPTDKLVVGQRVIARLTVGTFAAPRLNCGSGQAP